jgi:hypothetical protein
MSWIKQLLLTVYDSVETNVQLKCIVKCIYVCTTVGFTLQPLLTFYSVEYKTPHLPAC